MVRVRGDLCTGCGTCVEVCPGGAVTLANQKAAVDADRCTGCGLCIEACLTGAILALAPLAQRRPATGYPSRPALGSRNPPMWLTAGRAFLERWLVPMAVDRLIRLLETDLPAAAWPAST